jgi:signal transduction histidine kinase
MQYKLSEWGIREDQVVEEAQLVRLTNIVGQVPTFVYAYYVLYTLFIGEVLASQLAFLVMLMNGSALLVNKAGYYGIAKTMLFGINSFAIWMTYHIFSIDYSVTTLYFPLLICYAFFFDIKTEKTYLLISVTLTTFFIAACFLAERFQIHYVQLDEGYASLSNTMHVVIAFVITIILSYLILRNHIDTIRKLESARKEAETALANLTETQGHLITTEKMAQLGALMYGIGKEIKEPFKGIKSSFTSIKKLVSDSDQDCKEMVSLMHEGIERTENIIDNLNHLTSRKSSYVSCDADDILKKCIHSVQIRYGEKIKFDFKPGLSQYSVLGQEGKLFQVFLNLMTNAIHAIDHDQGKVHIQSYEANDAAHIVIEDNGVGMSEKVLENIKEPFFTTKEPGQGTGLGMFISNQIIYDHGGQMEISSEEGKGTTIHISLPLGVGK